jgi:hypothetical protein
MNKIKLTKIVSILIGVVIAVVLIVMGFRLFSTVFTRASDTEPRDVVVSDIVQNSAKVSWSTGIETQGVIEYGTSPTALNFFAPESARTRSHQQELTLLAPNTTYYFQIRIGDKKYDNGGVPWTFTTRSTDNKPIVSPTVNLPTPTQSTEIKNQPTPVQTIEVPATSKTQGCNQTDCAKIKEMLGKGCTTKDYFQCILKLTPSATPLTTP